MTNDISTAVTADFSRTRTELESMIKIPSVSAPGYDDGEVRRSADFVAGLLTDAGCDEVRLLEIDGAHPAVYAVKHGPTDAPTVLLYAHHDVQPPGPDRLWDVPPFDTVEIDGRLYGRGSADDKCGIAMHLSTLRVFGDAPPVTIKVLAEGEEEIGSLHLVDFLDRFADELAADVIVIADGGNWKTGVPALATSLRGLVDCTITVRTLAAGVHSGQFGGVYPDANMALVRTLAALHADDGSVAVPGLHADTEDELEIPHDELIE
ncbi:MAG: M20/M25/M40 family metallo-hydrolase, partial [Acidimicrobiia bacterium]|nr:M20/M25/M40 family metallo-hydrolase [Acidimicrobiia bacterium]